MQQNRCAGTKPAQRFRYEGTLKLVLLQATDDVVGLVLDAVSSVGQLVLSLGSDLVNPIKTACLDKRSKYLCWWVFIFI